jgi:limonene-1,2-epoxide hydrolase
VDEITKSTQNAVSHFLRAVEARNVDDVVMSFTEQAEYQNVPYESHVGRDAIRALFAPILTRSSRVQWEIVSEVYIPGRAHLERIDRFWIDGSEYSVPCHGVVHVDQDSRLISGFFDYLDLGLWREKVKSVLAPRSPAQ